MRELNPRYVLAGVILAITFIGIAVLRNTIEGYPLALFVLIFALIMAKIDNPLKDDPRLER